MGKKETENDVKKIADQIDAKMLDYLNLPLFEQLDKVRNDVLSSQESLDLLKRGKKKKKESRLTVVKILDKVKNDLMTEAGQLEQPQQYLELIEKKIRVLISSQVHSGMFDAYFRFMFVQALVGNGTHILNLEFRQELKAEFDLIQQSSFKNALFEVLNPGFLLPRKDEDIKHFWTDNKSLELLANYNRLSFVIKIVRSEIRKDRNLKKTIQITYGISDDWIDLVDSSQNIKDLALEWALNLMDIKKAMKKFYSLRKSKRKIKGDVAELGFEHLHNRILRNAREINPTKDVLVYCTFYGGGRQLGFVNPKSENVKLLKVEDWGRNEAYGDSVFFGQMSF
jgi:hypothetical protein